VFLDGLSILLIMLGALAASAGVMGIHGGRARSQASGPNALMHYPSPIPWLRARLTAAKWVIRVGQLYVLAGIALIAGGVFGMVSLSGPEALRSTACDEIAAAIVGADWPNTTLHLEREETTTPECSLWVVDTNGTRWFLVRSMGTDRLIGEGFNDLSRELARQGMLVETLAGLGRRAAIARPGDPPSTNPLIFFEDGRGSHRIEFNPRTVPDSLLPILIEAMHRPLKEGPY
jgi:hypothetical protein